MSAKIDQSLDEILATKKNASRPRRGRRSAGNAPVGGVRKSTRVAAKPAQKAAAAAKGLHTTGASNVGATKVIVSNLPADVTEAQIKEYFAKIAGPIRKVMLTYGPNGTSRGSATIIFSKPSSGGKALEANGTLVDKRSLKVEAIMDSSTKVPEKKSLSERVTQPNTQPKKVTTAAKPANNKMAAKPARGGRGGRGRGRSNRPKAKTAEELDAEMTDYFGGGGNTSEAPAATNAAAAAAPAAPAAPAGGAAEAMDDIS